MNGEIKKLLIIPHLKIHNANALSSPFTIGFPAMTAWLGAVHALERNIKLRGINLNFSGVGVVSHKMDLQVYKGTNDFVYSIIGTGNPLDKTGSRSAFIEEARCHLDVSLVIEVNELSIDIWEALISAVSHLLHAKIKVAGGDIQGFKTPYCLNIEEGDRDDLKKIQRALMPGYVLLERRDLMIDAMSHHPDQQGLDALDALVDYLAIHHYCETNEHENVIWRSQRKALGDKPPGWIVPIATGFHGISELGEAKNQRDPNAPHRFAESVVTLGEFKMPHRIKYVEDMLWRYHTDLENNLYLCQQISQSERIIVNNPSIEDSIESEFN